MFKICSTSAGRQWMRIFRSKTFTDTTNTSYNRSIFLYTSCALHRIHRFHTKKTKQQQLTSFSADDIFLCRWQLLPKFLTNHTQCWHNSVSQKDCSLSKNVKKNKKLIENSANKCQMQSTCLLCVSVPQTKTDSSALTQIEQQCCAFSEQKRAPSANRTAPECFVFHSPEPSDEKQSVAEVGARCPDPCFDQANLSSSNAISPDSNSSSSTGNLSQFEHVLPTVAPLTQWRKSLLNQSEHSKFKRKKFFQRVRTGTSQPRTEKQNDSKTASNLFNKRICYRLLCARFCQQFWFLCRLNKYDTRWSRDALCFCASHGAVSRVTPWTAPLERWALCTRKPEQRLRWVEVRFSDVSYTNECGSSDVFQSLPETDVVNFSWGLNTSQRWNKILCMWGGGSWGTHSLLASCSQLSQFGSAWFLVTFRPLKVHPLPNKTSLFFFRLLTTKRGNFRVRISLLLLWFAQDRAVTTDIRWEPTWKPCNEAGLQ